MSSLGPAPDPLSSTERIRADLDTMFLALLPSPGDQSARLVEAMRYAAIGGKRMRPLLTIASANLFGVPESYSLWAGLAVECVHAHSLIHDDLPCMDDDDLRRGRPTVHRAFDEATAVLAGDALLALAFEILADPATHPSGEIRAQLSAELARASGACGMAGGQMMDLLAEGSTLDIDGITRLQRLKTGALISWCVDAGAILGEAPSAARLSLRGYAQCLGLAFQIVDDLLDHGGDEAAVGKRLGKDAERGKATFVTLLGEERARRQAGLLVEQAVAHLHCFGPRAGQLERIARYAVTRDR